MSEPEHLRNSLELYILWHRERGQSYLPPAPAIKHDSTDSASISALQLAGHNSAPLLIILDAIKGQPLIFGAERELLLSLLRALHLKPEKDVLICALSTNQNCEPLAPSQSYRQELISLLHKHEKKGILILGSLAYQTLRLRENPDFREAVNQFVPVFGASAPPSLVSWHPADFINAPQRRKESWPNLKKLSQQLNEHSEK